MTDWLDWILEHRIVLVALATVLSVIMVFAAFKFLELIVSVYDWLFQKGYVSSHKAFSRAFWTAFPGIFLAVLVLLLVYFWGYRIGLEAPPKEKAMHTLNELYPGPKAY